MTPSIGFFYAGCALGEKAVAAAHDIDLPRSVLEVIDGSNKDAEGRAVRFEVRSAADIENVVTIAAIKMAN
jgi:hypothetical protein